ncbi:hypothetical protein [Ruminococcus sp. RTP21484sp1_RTP31023st1_H8_RTP31023_210422]|uniref:hypothetical protein n=1 Tax=Ruminococcus sp. RTP21484sp1_RTP31023st1_H8_RTP31023_210422 TaxID=3141611 RepID=UPI0034A32477
MKNKMISAMLLGMSATMAVPATAVFAEDLAEPSVLEEVAAETPAEPVETPVAETEAEVSYDNDTNEAQAEAPVIEEDVVEEGETAEVQIAEMAAYATDEEQKEADTPSDFKDKLADFEFEADTFGKYGAQLTEFIKGDEIDKSSLYNCEMSVIEKIQKLANEESTDARRALKYAIALKFESEYGEDAFQPGRDIRRAILSDSGVDKDYEFAVSEKIAEADVIYKDNGGITTNPKDLLIPEPEKELYEYVMGMQDFEMNQGEEINVPEISFDETYVDSVDIDTSTIDKDTAGVYKFTYVIKGVDGSTVNVEKQCTVKAVETPAEPEVKELYEYVYGMQDFEVKLGDAVPNPNLSYDTDHVASVTVDTSEVDTSEPGTYKIIFVIVGMDGETVNVEKTCTVLDNEEPAPEPEDPDKKELHDYVKNLDDIEMQVGSDIPVPTVSFDGSVIESVTIDTSAVDKDTVGTYPITYVITGLDGSVENVEKECRVVEDAALEDLRDEMCAKIDALGEDKFTESEFQSKWEREAEAAKAKIRTMTEEEDMQAEVDAFTDITNSIIAEQQLFVAKAGYVNILKKYHAGFSYETNAQKQFADDAMAAAIDKINAANTVDEAASALDAGKESIRRIGEQDADFVDELKESARKKLNAQKESIQDATTIVCNVYNAFSARLDDCKTAKDIESLTNSADIAFNEAESLVNGDMSSAAKLLKALKGISGDGDTTATIDAIAALGTPETMDDAESRVSDAWKAITCNVEDYAAYLSGRAGKPVTGDTKASTYANYVKVTDGTAKPDEGLQKAKDAAKSEVDKLLDEIKSDDADVTARKGEIKESAYAFIDGSTSEAEVSAALENARGMVSDLANDVSKAAELSAARTKAKENIQATVDEQTDESLKAAIAKLAEAAMVNIDAAGTADEISAIQEAFNTDVKTTTEAFKQDAALATAKADALRKMTELASSAKTEYKSSEMDEIEAKTRESIANAQTADECSTIYAQAKQDYKAAYLKSMRAVFSAKLDELVSADKFTDSTYLTKAQEVIATQKSNLDQATNEDTMQKCYDLAKENIDKLLTAQSTATALASAKVTAINQLNASYTNLSDQQSKVLKKYIDAINNATTTDEINDLVTKCDAAMKEAGANADTDAALAQAKADAISALTNMAATAPEANKEAAQEVLKTYTDKINAATTTDEVKQLLEDGKNALSKYGADANAAVPNSNTQTTLGSGSGSGDASQKGDATATTSVKTGDDNMGIIAIAGTAIMGALAAAFISLRKFIKK